MKFWQFICAGIVGGLLSWWMCVVVTQAYDMTINHPSPMEQEEDTARELIAENLASYNTAMAVGDTLRACYEAKQLASLSISTHVKLPQQYHSLEKIACEAK